MIPTSLARFSTKNGGFCPNRNTKVAFYVGPLGYLFISKANHNNAFHGIVNIEISFLFVNEIWEPN